MKNMRGGEDEAVGNARGGGGAEGHPLEMEGGRQWVSLHRLLGTPLFSFTFDFGRFSITRAAEVRVEELRKKLQGSRAEALEQEILKLRSEMFLMQVSFFLVLESLSIF